jgi:hypothetical protein
MNTQEQFDNAFEQWMRNHRYTGDAQTIVKIGQRVHENLEQLGGIVAASSFERSYLELVAEKAIRPFRGTVDEHVAAETPAIPQDVIDYIENPRTSAWEMNRRYRSDPTFRAQYDTYERTKGQNREPQSTGVSLTAEEYHRILAATIAARYQRDRGFKAAVDKLISEGRI